MKYNISSVPAWLNRQSIRLLTGWLGVRVPQLEPEAPLIGSHFFGECMHIFNWIENPESGIFLERPNRFTALVRINSEKHLVYLPDPGRLKELMIPGAEVIVEKRRNSGKTNYDLLLIKSLKFPDKEEIFVSCDSRLSNKFFSFGLDRNMFEPFKKVAYRTEPPVEKGRLDFLLYEDPPHYVEVKSVNLLDTDGVARFPDAPTKRGSKHLKELIRLKKEGYKTSIVFMINREDALEFSPFEEMDSLFSETLIKAKKAGVDIIALKNRPGIKTEHLNRIDVNLYPRSFPGYWPTFK